MTREEAIKIVKSATVYTPEEMEALETLIPELRESEDEKIRKEIIECIETLIKAPGASPRLCDWLAWLEKQKEQKSKIDACGFPLRDEGESACSYLERCLAPDMRNVWYEACSEIREKQKPDSECNSNRATYKSHRESWQNRLKEIYKINSSK